MMKIKHTCAEWNIILSAYIYECTDSPDQFMSDQSFDRECVTLTNHTIPGFDPNTGQWIKDLVKDREYMIIINEAYNWWRRYQLIAKHEGITAHCLIASDYIIDSNDYNNIPGSHLK